MGLFTYHSICRCSTQSKLLPRPTLQKPKLIRSPDSFLGGETAGRGAATTFDHRAARFSGLVRLLPLHRGRGGDRGRLGGRRLDLLECRLGGALRLGRRGGRKRLAGGGRRRLLQHQQLQGCGGGGGSTQGRKRRQRRAGGCLGGRRTGGQGTAAGGGLHQSGGVGRRRVLQQGPRGHVRGREGPRGAQVEFALP